MVDLIWDDLRFVFGGKGSIPRLLLDSVNASGAFAQGCHDDCLLRFCWAIYCFASFWLKVNTTRGGEEMRRRGIGCRWD